MNSLNIPTLIRPQDDTPLASNVKPNSHLLQVSFFRSIGDEVSEKPRVLAFVIGQDVTGSERFSQFLVWEEEEGSNYNIRLCQRLKEILPVNIVFEDVLPPISPAHHVVNRPGKLHSQFAWHTQNMRAKKRGQTIVLARFCACFFRLQSGGSIEKRHRLGGGLGASQLGGLMGVGS